MTPHKLFLSKSVILLTGLIISAHSHADLIGRWHFDEQNGSVAEDSAGNNDGNLFGDAAFAPVGIAGNAVSMSRAGNGFVNFGNIFSFTSGDFSYSFWVMMAPGDRQEFSIPLGKQVMGSANGHLVAINPFSNFYGVLDKAWFYMSSAPHDELNGTTSVNDGEWHHIVATYDANGQARLYVDGGSAEASRAATPIIGNNGDFHVGGLNEGSESKGLFDGYVDELSVYDHALSAKEVKFLFENPTGSEPGIKINAGLNDAWFNLATAGQGFFFVVFPDIELFFLSWFTFDLVRPDEAIEAILGEPGHRWVTAFGTWEGNTVTLDVELTSGGIFDSPEPKVEQMSNYGTITIVFHTCNSATLTYNFPTLGVSGSIELTRVTDDNVALCEALSSS